MEPDTKRLSIKRKEDMPARLDELTKALSGAHDACPQGVATELVYRLQRNPEYERNASNHVERENHPEYGPHEAGVNLGPTGTH